MNTSINSTELSGNNQVRRRLFVSEPGEESVSDQIARIAQTRSIEAAIKYQTTTTVTCSDELQEQIKKLYI